MRGYVKFKVMMANQGFYMGEVCHKVMCQCGNKYSVWTGGRRRVVECGKCGGKIKLKSVEGAIYG